MTERHAYDAFHFWCGQVRGLEQMTFAINFKGDLVEMREHEQRLKIARAAKAEAHDLLRLYKAAPPRRRPVRL